MSPENEVLGNDEPNVDGRRDRNKEGWFERHRSLVPTKLMDTVDKMSKKDVFKEMIAFGSDIKNMFTCN